MRAAQIENGFITNIIEVESLDDISGLIDAEGKGNIGDKVIDGEIVAVVPPPTQTDFTAAVQRMLDSTAQAHGYDSIISACSYAGAPNDFQEEGIRFITWRASCWTQCIAVLNAVIAGKQAQPTIAELLAALPAFPA